MNATSFATGLRCLRCDARYPLGPLYEGCGACATADFRSGVTAEYDYAALREELRDGPLDERGEGIWRYRRLLPVIEREHQLSLGEGNTPLVPLPRLASELGVAELWLKDEARNPTLSFKDRNAAVAVGKALDLGARTIVASSSGNHGLAAAAYAARAGLPCVVVTYAGISPSLSLMIRAYGARLGITTREGRWQIVGASVRERGWFPATNFTEIPTSTAYGHEGYKTIAYELFDQLDGNVPDLVVVPVGNGEGLFGVWKGFTELVLLGRASSTPRMLAAEPAGAPLATAIQSHARGGPAIGRVSSLKTVARGIGGTVSSYMSLYAVQRSAGSVAQVDDKGVLGAQRDLAREGIFAEPASAAALAALRVAAGRGDLAGMTKVVLVNTSSGVKNLEAVADLYDAPVMLPAAGPALEMLSPLS